MFGDQVKLQSIARNEVGCNECKEVKLGAMLLDIWIKMLQRIENFPEEPLVFHLIFFTVEEEGASALWQLLW